MRVVVANNYFYIRGGSERVMFDEIAALDEAGNQVIPFSRRCPENMATPYENYFQAMTDYQGKKGSSVLKTACAIVYSMEQKNAFGCLLNDVSPSLVHGHNIYGGLTFAIVVAAKERAVPFVLTLHDFKLVCPSYLMLSNGLVCERCLGGRFWNCASQRCHKRSFSASFIYMIDGYFNTWIGSYNAVSKFLCPSRFLLEKHAAGGIPREKLVYLPNALNPSAYEPSFEGGDYVLFVGRLSKEKGVPTLLRAFKDLNVPLRIAGTGPVEGAAKKYAEELRMEHVSFEGYCSGYRLRDLYRGAAFVVVPSEWFENAPMSVLESFAYGKPVVGSSIGGIPELVLPETGLLFDPGDERGLAQSVETLWKDKGRIRLMGREARARIEEKFCIERHLRALLEIYDEVIRKS